MISPKRVSELIKSMRQGNSGRETLMRMTTNANRSCEHEPRETIKGTKRGLRIYLSVSIERHL